MSWLFSFSCHGPSSIAPQQSSTIEWAIFVLFSPCCQRILCVSIHLLFFLLYLCTRSFSSFPQSVAFSVTATIAYTATLAAVSFASIAYGAAAIWHLVELSREGWNSGSTSFETVFAVAQAAAWLTFGFIVVMEKKKKLTRRSKVLRAWWFASSLLLAFVFIIAIIRLARRGLSYSARILLDDIIAVITFPAALLLFTVSMRLETGLSAGYEKEQNGLTQPLLNGSLQHELKQVPVSGFAEAGLLSKLAFFWLYPFLSKGYKSTLQIEDVPQLALDDRADKMYTLLQSNWPNTNTDHPLRVALWKSFRLKLFFTGCLAVIRALSMYIGPLLIQSFVDYIESDRKYAYEGYFLVFILLLGKIVEVLSTHHYNFFSQRLGMLVRSSLITAIYRKGLRLSSLARQAHGAGQIVNYMSVDVQQVNDSIIQVHNIWMLPFQIIIALLILYREIGLSMLSGFAAMIAFGAVISCFSGLIRRYSMKVMFTKDMRMKATTEALNYMKIIKLQAWEEYFRNRIERLRQVEYGWLVKFMYSLATNIALLTMSTSIVSLVTFGTCLLLKVELTSAKVFTVTSTFNILQEPIRTFPQAIIGITQALVSLDRINRYMLSQELDPYVVKESPSDEKYQVMVENGTFTWDDEKMKPTLHDVNFQVSKGSFVAVVGTVGSGKSSLLLALLGEMPKRSGRVKVLGSTAYVPQTAWIQNGTIEENILFGKAMDRSKYRKVIQACALEQDLAMLEYGDQTEIGERGINLSGGQKQRVQLARAVYQDSDVYLLDDIFSAVDAQTGSDLFKGCILGILRQKTRVLVTHQVEFLRGADLILVMQDGVIIQAGKYADLLESGTGFAALVEAHDRALGMVEINSPDFLEEEDLKFPTPPGQWGKTFEQSVQILKQASFSEARGKLVKRGSSNGSFSETKVRERSSKLIEEEKRETGRIGWNVYWLFLTKAYGVAFLVLVLFVQLASQAFSILSDFWLADRTSAPYFKPSTFISVYALLCLGSWIFVVARSILMAMFGLKTSQTFFLSMLRSIFRAPMSFFDTTPTGRILTRSSTDQVTIDIMLPLCFNLALLLYFATIGIVIVTCEVTWPVVLVILPLGWIYLKYQAFYITSSREISRLDSVTKAPVFHHFTETIAGFSVIRAFEKDEDFAFANLNRVNTNLKMDFHFSAANEWLSIRLEMIGAIVLCVAACLLIILPSNIINPAFAALSLSYGLSLNSLLAGSVFFSCTIENKMVSVERVGQYTRLASEAPLVIRGCLPSTNWPDTGSIQLIDLKVRYLPNSPLVIKGIDLEIQGGQKIGVVGRTGSGKSTLIQAIFRIVEPAGGAILIDDIDIAMLGLHDLRSRLGIIPQEPVLFEGTVRINMDPLGSHTDDEIWEAIRKCQLAEVIEGKAGKLDSAVAENGENFSVGQRQLLCLGRALLKQSRLLFLDEATASVDTQTDAVLQKVIREEFMSSTVVSIAHRIPSVLDCDKVIVLDAGKLKEYDSPVKLREQPASLFAALVREYTARSDY